MRLFLKNGGQAIIFLKNTVLNFFVQFLSFMCKKLGIPIIITYTAKRRPPKVICTNYPVQVKRIGNLSSTKKVPTHVVSK